jgi:hypothetical protein
MEKVEVSSCGLGSSPDMMTSASNDQYSKHIMMVEGIASLKKALRS